MASPALCFYCFETLAASYNHQEPPALTKVEQAWEEYQKEQTAVPLDDEESDDDEDDADGADKEASTAAGGTLQIPSVSRLQNSTSPASQSSISTPSSMSINSSTSAITNPSSVASESSTSLFSRAHLRAPHERYPLFVTWNTISRHGHKSLRGCIGTFEAQDLEYGLKSYALTSAFDDNRFSPIPQSLLTSGTLHCALTLLSDFEPCSNALDWTIGTHGIRISFIHRGRRYGSTYLPDVAVEQGWTKEECLESLMRKAGWDGAAARGSSRFSLRASTGSKGAPWEEVSEFKVIRYQGLQASATYEEWREWKDWVEKKGGF